jgi:prophage antirepressor-like protein
VAKDVAEALGYVNPKTAISQHCEGVQKLAPFKTANGMQKLRIINEPDLYRLIFGSELKSAKRFQ